MTNQSSKKMDILRQQSVLNDNADKVKAKLFEEHSFFDVNDLIQVKYEMLRSVLKENTTVAAASDEFGFSRPTFYQTLKRFKEQGVYGFIPEHPGPKDAHKLKNEIMRFIDKILEKEPGLQPKELTVRVSEQFNIKVHPRSISRRLKLQKKKK